MKNKLTILFIFIFIINSQTIFSQNNKTEMGLYNVGFGALTGGIGSVINKKPDQKLGRTFLKGLWKGAFGGTVVHCSKLIAGQIGPTEILELGWASNLSNSVGESMIQNTIYNKSLFETINSF